MEIAVLAVLGAVEAVVHLMRYRTAVGDKAIASAVWSGVVNILRLAAIWTGARAVIGDANPVLAGAVYAASPAIVTYLFHRWLNQKERP